MKPTQSKNFQFFLVISIMVWAWAAGVRAEETDNGDFVQERTYVGGFGTYTAIDKAGDFTGTEAFTFVGSPSDTNLIPSLSQNVGFAVMLGRREGPWAVEVSYWRSDHTASVTFGGTNFQDTATYHSINIDFKRYLFTQFPTQPFFSVGLSLPWIVVHNGSSIGSPPTEIGDDTLSGIGFNLGAGLEIYLGQNFSLIGSATERWAGYGDILGVNRTDETPQTPNGNDETLQASGLNFAVGATFGFE